MKIVIVSTDTCSFGASTELDCAKRGMGLISREWLR
jgi:hypothetical protein